MQTERAGKTAARRSAPASWRRSSTRHRGADRSRSGQGGGRRHRLRRQPCPDMERCSAMCTPPGWPTATGASRRLGCRTVRPNSRRTTAGGARPRRAGPGRKDGYCGGDQLAAGAATRSRPSCCGTNVLLGRDRRVRGLMPITAGCSAEFEAPGARHRCPKRFAGVAIGAAWWGYGRSRSRRSTSACWPSTIVNNAAKLRSVSGGQVGVPGKRCTPGGGNQQLSATRQGAGLGVHVRGR